MGEKRVFAGHAGAAGPAITPAARCIRATACPTPQVQKWQDSDPATAAPGAEAVQLASSAMAAGSPCASHAQARPEPTTDTSNHSVTSVLRMLSTLAAEAKGCQSQRLQQVTERRIVVRLLPGPGS